MSFHYFSKLFSGKVAIQLREDESYRVSTAHAAAVEQEIAATTATAPASQARCLRDVNVRFCCYKTVY